ncbi:MAG: alpha-1,2-fucosyltransferase [Eubacteriales bacterium]|nr:alpha-1,2-fucosyltransferase [Eubacteriales bacterium]
MIIVQIAGGLGNQMQQYALYRKLLALGRDAKIDLSWFDDPAAQANVYAKRAFELSYFRELPYEACTRQERDLLTGGAGLMGRVKRKLLPGKSSVFQETEMYHPEILERTDAYLCGYFACEKYYADILGGLRELFVFPESGDPQVREKNAALLRQIDRENSGASESGSCGADPMLGEGTVFGANDADHTPEQMGDQRVIPVSVHIRRGDYLDATNASLLGGICTPAYYAGAVRALRERLDGGGADDPRFHFYIFSDDPAYARTLHFGESEEENTVVDWNTGRDSLLDMQLMAHCRCNICANSTFSFWGARLNPHPDKLQVRPSLHKNTQIFDAALMHDYWKGWILANREGRVV